MPIHDKGGYDSRLHRRTVPYPIFGVRRGGVLEDDILAHLLASRMSCCPVIDNTACARCVDALELHDQLKMQLGRIRT